MRWILFPQNSWTRVCDPSSSLILGARGMIFLRSTSTSHSQAMMSRIGNRWSAWCTHAYDPFRFWLPQFLMESLNLHIAPPLAMTYSLGVLRQFCLLLENLPVP